MPGHKVLWPFSLFGWIIPPTDRIGLGCRLVVEEADCNLGEPPAGRPGNRNHELCQTYPCKDMTLEKAIPNVATAPPSLFVVEECWPLLGDQCAACVFAVLELCNGPVYGVSLGARGMR